jgi:polyhydroxyalkanoate synthesis regulator protein
MEMFKAAATAFVPGAKPAAGDEIAALKAQMAEMQKKLDALGK